MAANVKDVTAAGFATEVLERSHEVPVVVDFWAAWCGPCKVLGPTLERLAAEGAGAWELAKLDVDAHPQLSAQFGIKGIPTVIAFRDGRPVSSFTGALPEQAVRQFLSELVPSELDLAADQGQLLLEAGDDPGAEAAWRAVLAQDPTHAGAGIGLAGLLIERGDHAGALTVLGSLAPTEVVRQLQVLARLGDAGDPGALEAAARRGGAVDVLAYGRALAGAGRHEEALTRLLEVVERKEGDISDQARKAMLDLFELLGPESPLTVGFRRRLAAALF